MQFIFILKNPLCSCTFGDRKKNRLAYQHTDLCMWDLLIRIQNNLQQVIAVAVIINWHLLTLKFIFVPKINTDLTDTAGHALTIELKMSSDLKILTIKKKINASLKTKKFRKKKQTKN